VVELGQARSCVSAGAANPILEDLGEIEQVRGGEGRIDDLRAVEPLWLMELGA
jgi:hypothetical protein